MKNLVGKVTSVKMKNAAVVAVERWVAHPKYGKLVRGTTRLTALNLVGAKIDDVVRLVEVAPVSRNMHHRIKEVIKK